MRSPAFLLPALFAAAAALSAPALPQVRTEDGYVQHIEKVADGVWLIRQPQPFHIQPIGNVTVIEQSDSLVLVDGGGSPGSARRIGQLVRSISAKPVSHIIVTHWHGDHTLGLGTLVEIWPGARVIASKATRDALLGTPMKRYPKGAPSSEATASFLKELAGVEDFLGKAIARTDMTAEERAGFDRSKRELGTYRNDIVGMYLPAAVQTYAGILSLPDRKNRVELFQAAPANTDGDTAVWLARQRILIAGDIVVAPVPFGFDSYPSSWTRTLRDFKARRFSVLIPGHGAAQRDSRYIDQLTTAIEQVRGQVSKLARQGLSLEETRKRVDLAEQRQAFTGGDAWLGRWFDRYWVQPLVEAAWKEAKGLPIKPGEG